MEWLTPKLVDAFMGVAREGGLALTLLLVILAYIHSERKSAAKDKIIAAKDQENSEFQQKMLETIGEMKTVVSNGNLLLDLLTRGRK